MGRDLMVRVAFQSRRCKQEIQVFIRRLSVKTLPKILSELRNLDFQLVESSLIDPRLVSFVIPYTNQNKLLFKTMARI